MASVGETLEIEDAVHYGLNILGMGDLVLKDKQLEIIRYITLEKRDVMAVLPTGYGKSLVYQLIPPIVDFMEFGKTPSAAGAIVLVFSPLNALIRDQVIKLRESGLKACILKGDRVALDVEDAEEEEVHVSLSTAGPLESLKDFQLIFCHPEAVVENKKVLKMFKTTEFQRRIRAVVVDEAHFVIDWKDFRPSYGKLGILGSIFPKVPLLGMRATATRKACREIIESLGMFNPVEVIGNPDRPNIYFSASTRPDRGEDKYRTILEPLVQSLKQERENFPFTVIFGNLETVSSCYNFFSHSMGNDQYAPKDALPKAENRGHRGETSSFQSQSCSGFLECTSGEPLRRFLNREGV